MVACAYQDRIMGRSFINFNVHVIFHVKNNEYSIAEDDLSEVFRYMGGVIRSLDGYAFIVGGRPDHIHIFSSVPVSMSLSDFVGKIKSNTSRWIKTLNRQYRQFAWQEGYAAFSVSESAKDSVIQYIINQKLHHQKYSAKEEFIHFLEKHNIHEHGYKH